MWPDRRILDLLGVESPIIQAPMAGAVSSAMVIAVSEAGGLGSLPCAMLSAEQARDELGVVRQRTSSATGRRGPTPIALGLDPRAPAPTNRCSSHRGKDRSSRSFVMADTVYLRWRTRSHSRLWTSFPQPEVRPLVFPAGGQTLPLGARRQRRGPVVSRKTLGSSGLIVTITVL
jgi:tRNA-binding EMAP/Myf-like protein